MINLSNRSDNNPGKPQTDYLLPYAVGIAIASAENTDVSRQFSLSRWQWMENNFNEEKTNITTELALIHTKVPDKEKIRQLEHTIDQLKSVIINQKEEKENAIRRARQSNRSQIGNILGKNFMGFGERQ